MTGGETEPLSAWNDADHFGIEAARLLRRTPRGSRREGAGFSKNHAHSADVPVTVPVIGHLLRGDARHLRPGIPTSTKCARRWSLEQRGHAPPESAVPLRVEVRT